MSNRKARDGISLFINNDPEGAESFFNEQSVDIEMKAGKCFISLINALLTYDPTRFAEAENELRALQEECTEPVGWIESMKISVFGSSCSLNDPGLPARLEKEIILADCLVCEALLIFFRQDLTSYIKGGWRLRRAWKLYQHTYGVIQDLYQKAFGTEPGMEAFENDREGCRGITASASLSADLSSNLSGRSFMPTSVSLSSFQRPLEPEFQIEASVVERLMSEISFGYGIFQLCASLLPPNFLRIVHFLGVEGDRKLGLNALNFAKRAELRGPLALLTLLWYHTIVRPYLALDGANVRSGVRIACSLYEEGKKEFHDSAFFIFFLGKIERMKGNVAAAVDAFIQAKEKSPQREMKALCLHEIGWCYLIQLKWKDAHQVFEQLVFPSQWGLLFYKYKIAICMGADGDEDGASKVFQDLDEMLKSNNSWTFIELFIARRVRKAGTCVNKDSCTLLAFELMYLWNALPSCDVAALKEACDQCSNEPMVGLRKFLQGVIYSYQSDYDLAEPSFSVCLEQRKDIIADANDPNGNDDHISAFCGLELGTLLLQRGKDKDRGRKLLSETLVKYKGYDFEHKIHVRIPSALRWHR